MSEWQRAPLLCEASAKRVPTLASVRWIALVVAGGIVLIGARAVLAAEGASTAEPPHSVLRNCASRGEIGRPAKARMTSNDVRIGPLVLEFVRKPTAPMPRGAEWPFTAKTPVLLRARSRVVLAIAPEAVTRAAFWHRGGRRFVPAVRFVACSERTRAWSYRGTVGPTTFFPFGIVTKERAACIPLELWVEGRSFPIRRLVPIGRRDC